MIKPKFQTQRENVKLRKRNGGRAVQAAALIVIHLLVLRACCDAFSSRKTRNYRVFMEPSREETSVERAPRSSATR